MNLLSKHLDHLIIFVSGYLAAVFEEEDGGEVVFEDTLPNYISDIIWLRIDILLISITKGQDYFDGFVLSLNVDNPFLELVNELLVLLDLLAVHVYDHDVGQVKGSLDCFFDRLTCYINISGILPQI